MGRPGSIRKPRSLNFESSYDRQWTEVQRRGILVRTKASGVVRRWDPTAVMAFVISVLVFLPYVNTMVVGIAVLLSPRKHVYENASNEKLDYDREMSRFAAQAALIIDAYKVSEPDPSAPHAP